MDSLFFTVIVPTFLRLSRLQKLPLIDEGMYKKKKKPLLACAGTTKPAVLVVAPVIL